MRLVIFCLLACYCDPVAHWEPKLTRVWRWTKTQDIRWTWSEDNAQQRLTHTGIKTRTSLPVSFVERIAPNSPAYSHAIWRQRMTHKNHSPCWGITARWEMEQLLFFSQLNLGWTGFPQKPQPAPAVSLSFYVLSFIPGLSRDWYLSWFADVLSSQLSERINILTADSPRAQTVDLAWQSRFPGPATRVVIIQSDQEPHRVVKFFWIKATFWHGIWNFSLFFTYFLGPLGFSCSGSHTPMKEVTSRRYLIPLFAFTCSVI